MEKLHLISVSITNLHKDFIGFSFRPELFIQQVLYYIFVLLIFYILYGVGKFLERVFFKNSYDPSLSIFLKFSLGYVAVCSLIYILGFASQLSSMNVLLLLFMLLLISVREFMIHPEKIAIQRLTKRPNAFKILSVIFIIIAFLRLIPPQTAGDPLDYHLRFPRVYLEARTMMIPPLGDESYTTVPHLPEMLYIPTQIISNGLMSHVIHFGFFILIFLLLYNVNVLYKKDKNLGPLAALMFVSAPLMLQLGTQAFSDFPALFCFLVSIEILLLSKHNYRNLILSGILMGASLASKIWILYYYPFVVIFLFLTLRNTHIKGKIKKITFFLTSSLSVVIPWYLRAFLLVGNPFYINTSQGQNTQTYSHIGTLLRNFTPQGFGEKFHLSFEYGVVIYLGFIALLLLLKKVIKLGDKKLFLLFFLLVIPALIFPIPFWQGRYSLPYMLLAYMIAAFALSIVVKNIVAKLLLFSIFAVLILYYLFNTLIILPYGLGWANKDNFLRRNLIMDYASYYDYNGQFTKNINSYETVANYGVYEMYYANFKYKNVFYFINQNTHVFLLPSTINKLLVRGGDFNWLCKYLSIRNCSDYSVELITSDLYAKQYLYNIRYVIK